MNCLVICGQWVCSSTCVWDFVVDKEHLSRLVSFGEGLTVEKLEEKLSEEFGVEGLRHKISISYWPPGCIASGMGTKTPPILVTSDFGVEAFIGLLQGNNRLNMFVTFGKTLTKRTVADVCSTDDLKTPVFKRRSSGDEEEDDGVVTRNLFEADFGGVESAAYCPVDGREPHGILIDDDEFIIAVEKEEEKLMSDMKGKAVVDESREAPEVSDQSETVSRGYDFEFWGPFLDDEFGGSNAIDVMCTDPSSVEDSLTWCRGSSSDSKVAGARVEDMGDVKKRPAGCASVDRNEMDNKKENPMWRANCGRNFHGLSCVDADEFDIPPMVDDADFEGPPIPDLDRDEEKMYIGKCFNNKTECQISLAIYAIKNQFCFKQTRTKRDYFVVNCIDEKCDWRIMAHEIDGTSNYEIKKATLLHNCSTETRSGYQKKATNRVLAAVYKSRFGDAVRGPRALDLQQMVLEDLRVSASYMKCWRVKQTAIGEVRGSDSESFRKLPQYLRLLKAANPGTVAEVETDVEEDGRERFVHLFLAFGASIEGFRHLRPVLILDGTHLSGTYKGVLLTASGQDANFQVFPLGFGVVDSENDDSWTWFMMKLERIIADSPSLTIISDRHGSIYTAKSRIFPKASHGACLVHLQRNVNSKFKSKGLAKLVGQAARAYKVGKFREIFNEIKSRSHECGKFLEGVGIAHWSRAYFKGDRYNIMTSNVAESFNQALSKARGCPIIEMLMFIRTMMTRWFNNRRIKSLAHAMDITIEADKLLTSNMKIGQGSKINGVNSWSVEVIGQFGAKYFVLLNQKKCSCRVFDMLKFPCSHALFAADHISMAYGNLVHDYYKTKTWRATYRGEINPEADPGNEELVDEDLKSNLLPPRTRRPSGRPRENRFMSKGEFRGAVPAKVSANRCSRCHLGGHNRASCTNPI